MDEIVAFLKGSLIEDLYLKQPESFEVEGKEHLVCKLNKSMYSLWQSPKIWGDEVRDFLLSINFDQCKIYPCTYVRHDKSRDMFTFIYLHVDYLAITGNEIPYVKSQISARWEMEDLGVAQLVVAIHVVRHDQHSYSLNQAALAQTILDLSNFTNL